MGTFLPFREATFDGCISVSALQWLCYEQVGDVVVLYGYIYIYVLVIVFPGYCYTTHIWVGFDFQNLNSNLNLNFDHIPPTYPPPHPLSDKRADCKDTTFTFFLKSIYCVEAQF